MDSQQQQPQQSMATNLPPVPLNGELHAPPSQISGTLPPGAYSFASQSNASAGSLPQTQPPPAPIPVASAVESDDDDELDEEWINKAKEIVERTRDDPYRQNQELSKLKTEFLKVRHNRHVKPSDTK